MISLIIGSDIQLTPTEGFVPGGAILLHDLATSIAATPNRLNDLRQDTRWKDVVIAKFTHRFRRLPSVAELDNLPSEIFQSSVFEVLRQIHAENARKLAFQSFQGDYLIDDSNLRNFYGRIIGKIAHSHWWPTDELATRLGKVIDNIIASYGTFAPGNDLIIVPSRGDVGLIEDHSGDGLFWPDNIDWFVERGWPPWRGLELSGAVIEALCERWRVPLEKVVRRRSLREHRTLVIGKVGARNVRAPAYIVYKPKNT